jgi:hypothetical protein
VPDAVVIVAAEPETFEAARNGVYACPASYDRTAPHLAFYRVAPVSAITHHAPVEDVTERDSGAIDGDLGNAVRRMVGPRADPGERALVFDLGPLVALDEPVVNDYDRGALRGAWRRTLGDLREADGLSEL